MAAALLSGIDHVVDAIKAGKSKRDAIKELLDSIDIRFERDSDGVAMLVSASPTDESEAPTEESPTPTDPD